MRNLFSPIVKMLNASEYVDPAEFTMEPAPHQLGAVD